MKMEEIYEKYLSLILPIPLSDGARGTYLRTYDTYLHEEEHNEHHSMIPP